MSASPTHLNRDMTLGIIVAMIGAGIGVVVDQSDSEDTGMVLVGYLVALLFLSAGALLLRRGLRKRQGV
jgi:hypothetical protein